MTKSLLASLLVLTLAGCGATGAPTAAGPARATAGTADRADTANVATAERAIRASIEKRIADYHVSLKSLVVKPSADALFGFTADEEVSGLGGARRFHLAGSYDARSAAVKVLHRESAQ